jgi:hypothetical protein
MTRNYDSYQADYLKNLLPLLPPPKSILLYTLEYTPQLNKVPLNPLYLTKYSSTH